MRIDRAVRAQLLPGVDPVTAPLRHRHFLDAERRLDALMDMYPLVFMFGPTCSSPAPCSTLQAHGHTPSRTIWRPAPDARRPAANEARPRPRVAPRERRAGQDSGMVRPT